jgi:hypothetical protein
MQSHPHARVTPTDQQPLSTLADHHTECFADHLKVASKLTAQGAKGGTRWEVQAPTERVSGVVGGRGALLTYRRHKGVGDRTAGDLFCGGVEPVERL